MKTARNSIHGFAVFPEEALLQAEADQNLARPGLASTHILDQSISAGINEHK
jgi:hypothetical protein